MNAKASCDNPDELHREATRKVIRHLVPMMVFIYFLSFIDRTNVALAKSAFESQLGISAAVYGLGAGIFYLAYALLEVPSNLLAYRFGPRRWIARIAVTWGLISAAMMFVQGVNSFIAFRILLGIAEAGLFPALMYVTTLWFAQRDRTVVVGWIYIAPALGLVIGNAIGGALMQMDGIGGLHGWQWLFPLEGLPTVMVAIYLFFRFPAHPTEASWLSQPEARILEARAAEGADNAHGHASAADWLAALKRPSTVLMGLLYFFNQVGFVGLYFFVPAMVTQMDVSSPFMIGLLSGSVGIGFLLGVLILPHIHARFSSDFAFLAAVTVGLIVSAGLFIAASTPPVRLMLIGATAFFGGGILPSYWSIAMRRLHGLEAAAGLAFINTVGLIGGFVGPYLFGLVEKGTGNSAAGFSIILVTGLMGLLLIPFLAKAYQPGTSQPRMAGAQQGGASTTEA